LWSHFLLGPNEIEDYVGDALLNTDDFTLVEFQTPKSLFEDTMSIHIAEMKQAAAKGGNYMVKEAEPPADQAKAYYALAKGYLRRKKDEEAVEMIEKGRIRDATAEGDWLWGRILHVRGDRRGAEEAWKRALDKDKSHGETLLSLGKFYQEQGAYKKAAPLLRLLWEDHPEMIKGFYYHGVNSYYRGEYEEGLEVLNMSRFVSEPFGYYYLSLTYSKLGEEAEAKRALGQFIVSLDEWRRELEIDPKKFQRLPYRKLVDWRRQIGIQIPEEERMAQLFERVVETPLHQLYGGAGLFILGRFEDAARELEEGGKQLGRVAPGSAIYYFLGLAYKELGQLKKAEEALETFLQNHGFDPNDLRVVEAQKTLDRLKQVAEGDA
ncbi:MAG: tetratricopeptide repeat protein, partial [Nitrospiria bacterium]